ncbi:peptidoglycan-binding domain-containing protein [Psychromarinibacter sp. C21-152]|uniref:Peptidoglycan-binding domain-containing protein n=1 Tax=Psychromarinibacter sediminicola TaxID=3033385 RepID=A0AAE3NPA3_9RHOB|nr:peptidoglycan-binding domain-containing protein [Psychromarinibacter sediminicola]MDF0599974.1 peptidoglycan-binding domain-containing protein [Psychromarinibacter sediminicola]
MIRISTGLALGATLAVAGCGEAPLADVTQLHEPEPIRMRGEGPPGADPDGCYGQDATPAVIETVTQQVMLQPPSVSTDGKVLYPAVYKTETRQQIVEERRELWFETLCAAELTPEFVSSLQRALAARGHYRGPIDGEMTARTRAAIRAYQQPQGLDSAILSLAAARQLGLVEVARIHD